MEGSKKSFELNGQAKAELASLFKKLADVGLDGAGKLTVDDYTGVLQTELAPELKNVRECRQKVWADLLTRIAPETQRSSIESDKLKAIKLGVTSSKKVLADLGEPTSSFGFVSRYDFAGYEFYFYSSPEEKVNYAEGRFRNRPETVVGLAVVSTGDANKDFELDGDWNRQPWCTRSEKSDECKPFVNSTGFGIKTLAEYVTPTATWTASYMRRVGDTPGFFLVYSTETNVDITMYVQDPVGLDDDTFWKEFVEPLEWKPPKPEPGQFAPPPLEPLDWRGKREEARWKLIKDMVPARLEVGNVERTDGSDIDARQDAYQTVREAARAKANAN
ncbi:hypothetical protein [Rhizobium leguminosarum]|uniref:hypothetical protein n=1 Tax=Rhizobium leguminosarum TaxID=384 RepID=UPI001C98CB0D|nr:hypothetical protein [Rhizobium leguminosarum]MBY5666637.1 hypothetical protein [Rhizobium leguminosarum]MBY5680088.1 hypothetical protein [Rhizobium leguminosarum]